MVGAALGLTWHAAATALMGMEETGTLSLWPGIVAGVLTGLAATWHTVWTIRRNDGKERFWHGVANFLLAIAVYGFLLFWLSGGWVGPERSLPFFHRLIGSASFAFYLLAYGVLFYGIFLLPLCFASRTLVWSVANPSEEAD